MNRLTKDELNDIMFAVLEKVHDYRCTQKQLDDDEYLFEWYQSNIDRFLEIYQKLEEIYKLK